MFDVYFEGYGYWRYIDEPLNSESYFFDLYVNYKATGIFKLNEKDEVAYKYTKILACGSHLLPCITNPDSEFSRMVRERKFYIYETKFYVPMEHAEHCFFFIDQSKEFKLLPIVDPCAEAKTQKNDISETERQTMLKLIIGMAIHAYGYDPTSSRNPLTGGKNTGLSAKLALKDINITDDTIRKYLNEAKDLLYPEDQ